MRAPPCGLARGACALLIGLLLPGPGAASAQGPAGGLRASASAGFASGTLGYRLGSLEVVTEVDPGGLLTARLLVGSRTEVLCSSDELHPSCGGRAGFGALLGGIQLVPSRNVVEPYVGAQVGFYRYDGPARLSSGLLAVPRVGLRLRLGSLGGAYGDASYLLSREGGFPIAGAGLYLDLRSPR